MRRSVMWVAMLVLTCVATAGETGRLVLTSKPTGAEVALVTGNESSVVGETPTVVRLPIGRHTLRFSKEGCESQVVEADVSKGVAKVALVVLLPATHLLSVIGGPGWDGFVVSLDVMPVLDIHGHRAVVPCSIAVPAGKRFVAVTKRGFKDWIKKLFVAEDTDVILEKPPALGRSYLTPNYARWAHIGRWVKLDSGSVFEFRPNGTIAKIAREGTLAADDLGHWRRVGRNIIVEMKGTGRIMLREKGATLVGPNKPMSRWTLERAR